ncbi:formate/nitrite transporter family protein [Schaalia suimastitidis]|uniref:formate/nitrite transporter family protein n=1 Tax=Schaalia suimastitidis TaxID=121163 RepID=UPI000400A8FB|nr:formate/nitrite transporter family protein [Schaalia suimastitidis]
MLTLRENIAAQVSLAHHKMHGARRVGPYIVAAMLAGTYIGLAGIFMLCAGGPFRLTGSPAAPLVEGGVFGIGLILTTFAGGELATSAMMILPVSLLERKARWFPALRTMVLMILGNLAGAMVLSALMYGAGIMDAETLPGQALAALISAKTHKTTVELFFRGILCNILVCLAMWSVSRTSNDVAKMILMGWCMAAFVASGMEHVVANMTTFSMALFYGVEGATVVEVGRNLGTVFLGNLTGGAIFVGLAQWLAAKTESKTLPSSHG